MVEKQAARTYRALLLCLAVVPLAPCAADVVVEFPDPMLEQLVREAIDKPTGDILDTDLVGVGFTDFHIYAVSDLTGLEYCLDLETLVLNSCGITDISPLVGLFNLRDLGILEALLTDFTPLASLVGLEKLGISEWSYVSDLGWLSGLTALNELGFWVYKDVDLSPLAGLTNVTYLGLGGEVSDISVVAELPNLTRLCVLGKVSDLSPVAGLTNLFDLTAGTEISDLSPLAGLTNLKWLELGQENFWGNKITDISVLAGLPNLESLHLENNSIADIGPLAGLTNPIRVWLTGNLVSDLGPLVANPGIDDDDEIYVRGNPLSQQALCTDIPALWARGVGVSKDGVCGGAPPVITKQPGGGFVEVGQPHTFTIEATGVGNIRCWWRKDGYLAHPFTTDCLTIWHVAEEDEGLYRCLVVDDNGSTMSHAAYLQVVPEGSLPASRLFGLLAAVALIVAAGIIALKFASRQV